MKKKIIKNNNAPRAQDIDKKLAKLRKGIDACDTRILEIFQKRFQVAKEIGKIKATGGVPVRDIRREKMVIYDRVQRGKEKKLSEHFVTTIWKALFKEAYTHQQNEDSNRKNK